MPAYIKYFQNQHILGLWFTLLSVLNWILTFDFGIGNGLRNKLAIALAKNDTSDAKSLISTTYGISITISLFFFIVFILTTNYVNWNLFFNIPSNIIATTILRKAVLIVLIGIIFQFILKVITSILLAYQMPSISNLLGFLTNFIIFIAVLSLSKTNDSSGLIILSTIYSISSNLPLLIATIIAFTTRLKDLRPSIGMIDKHLGKSIMRLGMAFFILQILSLALFNMKEFLISWTTSPEYVVEFQIYNRLFSFIVSIAWIALIPVWSAVTEAYTKRDYVWISKIYNNLRKAMILVFVTLLVLAYNLQTIIDIWLGVNSIEIQISYSLAFCIYCLLYIWWGVIASFANGTGKIRPQLIYSTLGVIINLTLTILFVNVFKSWIGIIYAGIISMIPYCMIEPLNINKLIKGNNYE
jgi:O-antigen/teichoic acid export membrane protein